MGNPNNDPAASVADTTVTDNQQIQILDGKGTSTWINCNFSLLVTNSGMF